MVNPFSEGAATHPELVAHWNSRQELWTFHQYPLDKDGRPPYHFVPAPAEPKTQELFTQAVRRAFALLNNSMDPTLRALTNTLREPCQVWLDLMRSEKRGFRRTEQVRSSHARFLTAALETGAPLPPDAIRVFDDGDIEGVFAQSAAVWDDIAARGSESTTTPAQPQTTDRNRTTPAADMSYPTLTESQQQRLSDAERCR
jgi:hypothetical protein